MPTSHEDMINFYKEGKKRLAHLKEEYEKRKDTIYYRKRLIEEYEDSKLSLANFCEKFNFSVTKLQDWRRCVNKQKNGDKHVWARGKKYPKENTDISIISESESQPEMSIQSFTPGDQLREELFNELVIEHEQAEIAVLNLRHRMKMLSEQWDAPIN